MYGNLLTKVKNSLSIHETTFWVCTLKMLKALDFPVFFEKMAWNFGNPILQDRNWDFTLFFNSF